MFQTLKIKDVRHDTPDAVIVSFENTDFSWKPGQYLTLRTDINGKDLRRSYSIATMPGKDLCVGIKHVEGGAFSTHCQNLRPGMTIDVMKPEGRFTLGAEQKLILIASGSGITPMISIAAAALENGAEVALIYGNKSTGTIMFREELDTLKDRFLDRFTLIHILSRETQDVAILNGRITGEKILALGQARAIDLSGADGIFLCGPGKMIDDVSGALTQDGVPTERIHFERFFQEGESPHVEKSVATLAATANGALVEIILDGTRRKISMTDQDDTVLDAAERQGLELPYSCRGGMCCTCRCKVTQGSAEMATNYSLESWETEAGFILACQTRPTTDTLTLDFDVS